MPNYILLQEKKQQRRIEYSTLQMLTGPRTMSWFNDPCQMWRGNKKKHSVIYLYDCYSSYSPFRNPAVTLWPLPCHRGVASPVESPLGGRTTWPWPPCWSSKTPRGSPLCPHRAAGAGQVTGTQRSPRHARSPCPARWPCRKACGPYPSVRASVVEGE